MYLSEAVRVELAEHRSDGFKRIVTGVWKTSNPWPDAEQAKQSFGGAFHLTKLIALGDDSAETLLRRGDAYLL
jgi:hypothetical protein